MTTTQLRLILRRVTICALVALACRQDMPALSAGLVNDWLRETSPSFEAWDIGGEIRLRYDRKENAGEGSSASVDFMKRPPAGRFNDNDYLIVRERIHVGFSPTDWFTAYVGVRDANGTGDRRDPPKTTDCIDLEQLWLQFGNPKAFPVSLKVGRQDLVYGDERMMGRSDWNNLGWRAFDAGRLRYEKAAMWVDLFMGRPVMIDNHNLNTPNEYDWVSGLYASTKALIPFQESQCYFLAHNVSAKAALRDPGWISSPSTPQDTYTIGLRFKSLPEKLKDWDYTLETAAQLGNVRVGGVRLTQEAFAVMVGGGYTWKKSPGTPRVGIGYDFFSGDADSTDDKNGTFEPLFPTNHRPLGLMDLVGGKNIHDTRVSFSLKPAKPLSVSLEYHGYWLANTADFFYSDSGSARNGNGYGRRPQLDAFAGSELDLDILYTFKPSAVLRSGYGHFFPGRYVRSSLAANGGAQDADWFYTQVSLAF